MPRDERLYLEDIRDCCDRISRYTRGMSGAAFQADEKTLDAVLRNLEIIGEAVKHLTLETRERVREVSCRQISRLHDLLAHVYFGVDEDIIWDIVQQHVPALAAVVQRLLRADSSPSES